MKPHFKITFLLAAASILLSANVLFAQKVSNSKSIDRYEWVNRHNVHIDKIDYVAPITVGNGDFGFTADVTGMQSFPLMYREKGIAVETLCNWAWHEFPNVNGYTMADASAPVKFHERMISYVKLEKSPAGAYFRENPQSIPLGQIGLVNADGSPLKETQIDNINQTLSLWQGIATSQYTIDGTPVEVQTISDPKLNAVAFKIRSSLLVEGKIKPNIAFAYAYDVMKNKNKPPLMWDEEKHTTEIVSQGEDFVKLKRTIDDSIYYVTIRCQGTAELIRDGQHNFNILSGGAEILEFSCLFSPSESETTAPSFAQVRKASAKSWTEYWMQCGAVDLSGSTDPRAMEFERRIVLSIYLVKVNYSGSYPPQESGLANISWFGKHNTEMYWWHAAQFYGFNHTELLEKGLGWYQKILPAAIADAKEKGFEGAHWPKMAGPAGRETPGGINPFIIWNQPNPIYLCELVYRAYPTKATLEKYSQMVFESAKYLASYAYYDEATDRYILGPPVKSVSEGNDENNSKNPTFELAFWSYSLSLAQQWRERMGLERNEQWDKVISKMAKLTAVDGLYVELETEPDIFKKAGGVSSSMIQALGYMPQTPVVDADIMKATFNEIMKRNGVARCVSWSQAKFAMTAARLGLREMAVDIMCNDAPAAHFHKSGYVQRPKDPIANAAYLPVNSSFLAAVALMVAGWDNAPDNDAPGFPKDGTWVVRYDGLNRMP
jgi:Trehalose and maltose hydrolases (possible phosphorylases)